MSEAISGVSEHGARRVFRLAWPLTLKSMMLFGVVVIDALLVAPLGESGLAAMGLAASLGGLLVGALFGFSNATQISLSRAHGSGDALRMKTSFFSGLAINLVLAIFGTVFVILFGAKIIGQFAHSPEIAAQATGYLFAFLGVLFGEVFAITLTNYFNATGDTRRPLFSYLLTLPLNVALSAALIYGIWYFPALGVMGAAIGSAVAAIIRALFLGIVMARENGWLLRHAGWHGAAFAIAFKRHLLFSLPIAATFISATTSATACGLIYAGLSINNFAAMTLILPWIQFVGTLGMAWAQAAGIIVGQMLGSRDDTGHVDQFLREAWQGAMAAACLVAVIYLALCLASGGLYANLEQETRRALLSFLPILIVLPFPKGSNAMCGHSLRAGGDTVYVMNLFVLSQWLVRVPFTYVLVVLLDVHVAVVLFILLLEELVKFIPFHTRFKSGHWKTAKVLTD